MKKINFYDEKGYVCSSHNKTKKKAIEVFNKNIVDGKIFVAGIGDRVLCGKIKSVVCKYI